MKAKHAGRTLWNLLLIGCYGLVLLLAAEPGEAAPADRHVVVISLDGLAAFLLDDPKAPLPTLRKLAREGAVVDGGMLVSNPSVTWPNHTTLVTGVRPEKHGVLANGVLVRGGVGVPVFIDGHKDKQELVRGTTVYDVAHAAGLSTAEINWPCTRGAKTLGDSFPDVPNSVANSTPRLIEELVAEGLLKDGTDQSFRAQSSVGRDYIWTQAACHLIRRRQPNLLLLHLLNVDGTHHAEGAQSSPGYTANAYADTCVARVLAALDEAGIRERTTVIVVSDHGFALTPKAVRPNVILRQQGLLTVGPKGKLEAAQVHVVSEGGIGLVYCTDPGTVVADRERVKKLFLGQEGIADVLSPEQFAEYGLPHPRAYGPAPDLVLVAQDGYAVSGSAEGETLVCTNTEGRTSLGSHGFLSTLPKMNALCILSGVGVRAGVHLKDVENIDVAPTVARLLGLSDFSADGKVLADALR
ncbi:MAG: nucleotide pyrophosphatase/phosphodiesterase family protein [Pirellulaceae bacterium]